MTLVWDYRTGDVINAETGEVVDRIYVASPTDGVERKVELRERVHCSALTRFRFRVTDPTALQLRKLGRVKGTPSLLRGNEDKLYRAYRLVINYLSQLKNLSRNDYDIIEKVVRDAAEASRYARHKELVIAATAIVMSARLLGMYVNVLDVAKDLSINPDEVLSTLRKLSVKYKVSRYALIVNEVRKIANTLGEPSLAYIAEVLLGRLDTLPSKPARSIAAGLVYTAALLRGKEVTQDRIADITGISTMSVRQAYQYIVKKLNIKLERSKAFVLQRVYLPSDICDELHGMLANYVMCR